MLHEKFIISDPLLVHVHSTRQLRSHHSLNTQRAKIDWSSLLNGDLNIVNIDIHLVNAFQQSLMKNNKSNLPNIMATVLNTPITFEMFQKEIISKAKDKSPGQYAKKYP